MFRTFLVAVLSVLALSSVGVGVAVAATPAPAVADCVQVLNSDTKCDTNTSAKVDANVDSVKKIDADRFAPTTEAGCNARPGDWHWVTLPVPGHCEHDGYGGGHSSCIGDQAPNIPGCQRGGPAYHGPVYRDCNDARGHGYYNVRRGDSRYNDSWDRNRDGVACDDGDLVVVSNDGDCVTYATARDSIRNYGLAYNRYRTQYNGDWSRMSRNIHDRDDLARLYSQSRRYSNEGWNQTRLSNLRTVCKDTSPTVTIVNEAPPATIINSAPAATYSAPAPQVSTVPSGAAQTGGLDEAHSAS